MERTPKGYILTIGNRADGACDYNSQYAWRGNVELRERLEQWASVLQPGEKLSYTVQYETE